MHAPALTKKIQAEGLNIEQTVVAAPDVGSIRLVKGLADFLKTDFVIIDKRRLGSENVELSAIIGEVKGKDVIFVDDLCSTASTLCLAAKACKERGAKKVYALITHGLFVGDAKARIEDSPIEKVFVSDTIPLDDAHTSPKIEEVSIAHLFGEGIRCVLYKNSMSSLFTP